MKEEFLHYIWENQFFDKTDLKINNGKKIQIMDKGLYNTNAGPDFINAKIKIDNLLWVGNIEIHVKSSDWSKHNHQDNKAYNNVILHLVYQDDKIIQNQKGDEIQTLILNKRINVELFEKFKVKFNSKNKILCASFLQNISDELWKKTLNEQLIVRLARKTIEVERLVADSKNDLQWVLFFLIAQSLGLKVNKEPMQMLARSIAFKLLAKYQNDQFKFSALLFGQAGFLDNDFSEDYPAKLKAEYNYLKHKHNLVALEKHIWKFMRLRPSSFPTIRIAQLLQIMSQPQLYSKIKEAKSYGNIKMLIAVELDSYWDTHYVFDKVSVCKKKKLGKATIDIIIINAIVPYYLFIAKKDERYKEYAISLLRKISVERNSKVKYYLNKGKSVCSAADSQALIQLYDSFCSSKKCLTCNIGKQLMLDE